MDRIRLLLREIRQDRGNDAPDAPTTLAGFDAILLGAVGYPGVPDDVSLWGLLIPLRRAFNQYVNLRPVRLLPGIASPLAGVSDEALSMVIVRENTEGEYSPIGGVHNRGNQNEFALQESVFTRIGCERIIRYAFELAASAVSGSARPPSRTA